MSTHANKENIRVGDSPGTGRYRCCQCGEEITVTGPRDQLPPCPQCGADSKSQYEAVDEEAEVSHGVEPQNHRKP